MGGGATKYFLKNYWAMKYLGLWSPGLRKVFEKFVKPSSRSPTYLMYAPLLRILRSYCTWFCIEYQSLHSPKGSLRYIKAIACFLFPNISAQGKLFVLFRRSCLWKISIFWYFGKKSLLLEGMFAKSSKIYEDFLSLQVLYKWIPPSFALRNHSP